MRSEYWLKELEDNRPRLEKLAVRLCDKIKEIYKNKDIKVIVTYRIKGKASLAEKIERHNIDKEINYEKSIFELFNDNVGIRIICMKICDENKVYRILKESKEVFPDEEIYFYDNINIQPTSQKNGHDIYKFDGFIKETETKFTFEIQIKSLANLFWGEMEHLLFYKNSKVLISNGYYEKEINSIYDELKNIDNKLTYMEEAMMSESDEDLLQEKIQVFKRYAYIQLKECLKNEFGDHLNNKYIFNAVGDYLFRTYSIGNDEAGHKIIKDPNEILRKTMYVLLDTKTKELNLSLFLFDSIEDKRMDEEIIMLLNDILKERKNGWWAYVVLSGIYSFFQDNIEAKMPTELNTIRDYVDLCMKNLRDVIHKEINLYTKLSECDTQYSKEEIKEITLELTKKYLEYCSEKKNLSFTEKKFANNYNNYGVNLFKGLVSLNPEIFENFHDNSDFIEILHSILANTNNVNNKITSYVKQLDKLFEEKLKMSFIWVNEYFKTNKDITVQTFFRLLGGENENGN